MAEIIRCKTVHEKKVDDKWILIEDSHHNEEGEITLQELRQMQSEATKSFFRSIKAEEQTSYYSDGRIKRVINVAPDKQERIVYTIEYHNKEE